MMPTRTVSRRSFLVQVIGGLTGGGALALVGGEALAFQVTDHDPTDPVGRGRGGSTGVTDQDVGTGADPAGRGRGAGPRQGTGITDSDSGPGADPVGRGRGGGGRPQTGLTDRDIGANADPVGRGRGSGDTRSSIGLPEDQRRERCQNNRARLAQLELQTTLPSGWSEAQLASARQDRARIDSALTAHQAALQQYYASYSSPNQLAGPPPESQYSAGLEPIFARYGIPSGAYLRDARSLLTRQITTANTNAARRAELHRQIGFHRNNLVALGCQ